MHLRVSQDHRASISLVGPRRTGNTSVLQRENREQGHDIEGGACPGCAENHIEEGCLSSIVCSLQGRSYAETEKCSAAMGGMSMRNDLHALPLEIRSLSGKASLCMGTLSRPVNR